MGLHTNSNILAGPKSIFSPLRSSGGNSDFFNLKKLSFPRGLHTKSSILAGSKSGFFLLEILLGEWRFFYLKNEISTGLVHQVKYFGRAKFDVFLP